MNIFLLLLFLAQPQGTGGITIPNTEIPTPTNVVANSVLKAPPYNAGPENTGIYCKLDHRNPAEYDFIYCLYFEQDADQNLAGGAPIKIIQRGNGDAMYVAIMGDNTSGYGYEAAAFGGWADAPTDTVPKQENLYIATFQGNEVGLQESVKNQSNTIAFHALVHNDGQDPTDPDDWTHNYSLFLANNALGYAYRVRASSYSANRPMIAISDTNYRDSIQQYKNGELFLIGPAAVQGGDDEQDSPEFKLRGTYNPAGTELYEDTLMKTVVDASGAPSFYLYTGQAGSEGLRLVVNASGLSLQNNNILDVGKLTLQNGGNGVDMQATALTTVGSVTMYGSGSGIDMQQTGISNATTIQGSGTACASLPAAGNAYTVRIVPDANGATGAALCIDNGSGWVIADGSGAACCP